MYRIIRLITIAFCIALLLSYLGSYVDPRKFWPLAFLTLAYVPLLFVNVLFLLFWALRKSYISFIPLFCILLGWFNLTNSFSLHKKAKAEHKSNITDSSSVRLMTYNVHAFNDAFQDPKNGTEVLKLIKKIQPEIACFQEFYSSRNTFNAIDSLKKIAKAENYYFENFNGEGSGMAIFSKYPIKGKGIVPFSEGYGGNQCLFIDISRKGKTFRIYTVHLASVGLHQSQINYMSGLIKGKTQELRPTKKIGGQLRRAFWARAAQVDLVKNHAATCPFPYIICGDFNDPPSSFAFRKMSGGLQNTFKEKGTGFYAITLHKGFLRYQIDHILASPEWTILNHVIVSKKASDHYPVFADLKLQ